MLLCRCGEGVAVGLGLCLAAAVCTGDGAQQAVTVIISDGRRVCNTRLGHSAQKKGK